MIDGYIKLRDKKEALIEQHRQEIKKYTDVMAQLEGYLRGHLKSQKLSSISCDAGTAFIQRQRSATVADTATFREFIISNSNFDLADFRPKKDAVEGYIEEHDGEGVPGVNFSTRDIVLVQRR
jgi:hypothetical protein